MSSVKVLFLFLADQADSAAARRACCRSYALQGKRPRKTYYTKS